MEASFTILVLALLAATTVFWVWALVDVLRRPTGYRTGTQPIWAVVVALTHSMGALVYVVFGRPRSPGPATPTP
ncbi:MAG TPA: PLD nuclease N-terminal domain-containing protein [Acidimicrobiales bacterium]|nr:PLD nuclease N-terminal domain-containing protein [Acidimicrobiales bacterium]